MIEILCFSAARIMSSRSNIRVFPAVIERQVARASIIEGAISSVFSREAEDDEFNQLVLFAGLDPQPVVWLRAWFRYARQTGSSFGLVTIVDALRRAPKATAALVGLFTALHDPSITRKHPKSIRPMARSARSHVP